MVREHLQNYYTADLCRCRKVNWNQLISTHFNVFLTLSTFTLTILVTAIIFIANRFLKLRIRKYILEAEEMSQEMKLKKKKLEWENDFTNRFIIEPLIDYLEEGLIVIEKLHSQLQEDREVKETPESAPELDQMKILNIQRSAQVYDKLAKHQQKSGINHARVKHLEDSQLQQAFETFTESVAYAGEACQENNIDGLFSAHKKASKSAVVVLKLLTTHQAEGQRKSESPDDN